MGAEWNDAERLRWEKRLIDRASRGDADAFAEIYRTYAGAVFSRVLVPKLGNRDAAEDALAETFRTAWKRMATFEAKGVSVYFWLCRIAANKATDMHRARATTGRALAGFEALVAPFLDPALDPATALAERNDVLQLRAAIAKALDAINPRYQTAIRLRFLEEREREECAKLLDVKLGTFDVLLLRALRALKKQLHAVEPSS